MQIAGGGVPGKFSSPVGKPVREHPTEDLIMAYRLTRAGEIQIYNEGRRLAKLSWSGDYLFNAEDVRQAAEEIASHMQWLLEDAIGDDAGGDRSAARRAISARRLGSF